MSTTRPTIAVDTIRAEHLTDGDLFRLTPGTAVWTYRPGYGEGHRWQRDRCANLHDEWRALWAVNGDVPSATLNAERVRALWDDLGPHHVLLGFNEDDANADPDAGYAAVSAWALVEVQREVPPVDLPADD